MSAQGRNPAIKAVAAAARSFLHRHPPFDGMEEDAMRFLASRLAVGYYPKGNAILQPVDGEPAHFYVVHKGIVQLSPAETYHLPGGAELTLGPGECFSVGALLERRPVASAYVAAADTFCYQLAAADFHELLGRSPRFREFSTRYLASLLRESRRLLHMHYASLATEQQAMGRTLRSLLKRPPVTCTPGTPLGEALRAMAGAGVGSIVITGPDGSPAGIFTRHDVIDRVTLPGRSTGDPISSVMTPAPHALPAEATANDAALTIAHYGIRHIPVIDEGKVIGVVTERDLFALQRVGIRSIHRTIADAADIGGLRQAASDTRILVISLISLGSSAEPLTQITSALNDELTRRVIDLERARHGLDDLAWSWLGFGSEGRYEQTIGTDQDNGILFVPKPGQSPEEVRGRLLPFAKAVNRALDVCGYPLCIGNIMAGNPHWCLSLDEWLQRFDSWIRDSNPQALLNAAIFFDFRVLHGLEEPVQTLRERLLAWTMRNPRFLRQMAEQAVAVRPPLGVLNDFVTDGGIEGRESLDLKKSGSRLFVDAARIIALASGIAHTSTAQRLRQGAQRVGMRADEASAAVDAFFFIQMLRLRRQIAVAQGDAANGGHNRMVPGDLNEVDRRMLKESLRQARRLQSRLALDYRL
jgi:CBS domain-containing protein